MLKLVGWKEILIHGDKIFKLESKTLSTIAKESYSSENIKTLLDANITIKKDTPISITVRLAKKYFCNKDEAYYHTISSSLFDELTTKLDIIASEAINNPITKERIITQISKTKNTPFEFDNIDISLDDNLYINISDLNELRRKCLENVTNFVINAQKRNVANNFNLDNFNIDYSPIKKSKDNLQIKPKISLLLSLLDINTNYSELENVDNVYIPLKYFANPEYANIIKNISLSFNTYIYMPTIIKGNYRNLFTNNIDSALETYTIKGFVLSNIGTINMLEKYQKDYEFIGNYTLNVFNNSSLQAYTDLGIQTITLSPELNKNDMEEICNTCNAKKELIVYGKTPVMTTGYCLLGDANKCYPDCKMLCKTDSKFYLKDRLGLKFRILPDNIQTITTIYNSKTTSIDASFLNLDSIRIDILDENIFEVNNIISRIKDGKRLDGKDYTNGNFVRDV